MRRLGFTILLTAGLAQPACIIDHGLGETAEGSDGSDTGGPGDTGVDPSATSGVPSTSADPPTATSGSEETDVGTDPSDGTDGDPTDTDGEPGCETDEAYVRWLHGLSSPLDGLDPAFVAIVEGSCAIGPVLFTPGEEGDPTWELTLDCSLGGRLDGEPEFVGDVELALEMTGTAPHTEVLGSLDDTMTLRVVLDWWGMGWNSWLVLERSDGVIVLDLVDGEYLDPADSTWGMEVTERLGGQPWHGGLTLGTQASVCGGPITKCNDEPMAVTVAWEGGAPLVLHPYQEGSVGTDVEELMIRTSVTAAHATPMPTCTDMPLAVYQLAAWAVEP